MQHDRYAAREAKVTRTRIAFHIHHFGLGGTETALMGWLHALDRGAFDVDLIVGFPTEEFEQHFRAQLPGDVRVHFLADRPWQYRLETLRLQRRLSRIGRIVQQLVLRPYLRQVFARRIRALAAHYNLICDFDLSLRQHAGAGGKPWIGISHFSLAARLGNRPAKVRRLARQYARYAAVAALNADMAREARQMFGAQLRDVIELPNVIDPAVIRAQSEASVELPTRPYIVSVARLDGDQKDHETLLDAYARMRERGHGDAMLVLVGDGPYRPVLEQRVSRLGLADSVVFAGFHVNPFPFMRHARVLVLSSRFEGFGMVLLEAMALGTPVVSSDCPNGPREVLADGEAGLLVPVGDSVAMAEVLQRVLTDDVLRRRLVSRGLARVQEYGPHAANRRLMELASRLCKRDAGLADVAASVRSAGSA
ncbi:glycosyltransferase [Mycetohabitans sp. B5]|uniref:Glycosyltransferase involved in cell wall biosynthesis n=1 Tax=Mycetohabitans endofungorum TaxID=417203 RepID=A0A2P5KDB0_9BURK|nr:MULTISPECIES: glycosyltransferase [Mycetohabitans]MCG1055959.1 glycosyltransferase [Mycetohabitans sp. B5]PPB84675.1 glycosyltransferase involved in cell wall biosynthesis [Mycetohabitans endofungorum]